MYYNDSIKVFRFFMFICKDMVKNLTLRGKFYRIIRLRLRNHVIYHSRYAAHWGGVDDQRHCLGGDDTGVEAQGLLIGQAQTAQQAVEVHEPHC